MGYGYLMLLINKKWQIHHKQPKMWFVERSLFAILRTILQAKKIVRSTQLAGWYRVKRREELLLLELLIDKFYLNLNYIEWLHSEQKTFGLASSLV